ncbi:MAG: ammonium transporter [Alphaproteobacteria bacterium]|nr:ammonium transporter [Alphaproteobacteria bacterium]
MFKNLKFDRLKGIAFLSTLCAALAMAGGAFADDPATAAKIDSGDTAWMLTSTALVLLMTIPGLALFYCGLVRKKNVLATAMQSFATTCVVCVVWAVCGYGLAFMNGSADTGWFVGDLSRLFLHGMDVNKPFILGDGLGSAASPTTIPESVFMMFQMTFAIITPALITGAFADRMKFPSMLVFMVLWSIIVYSPVAHWMWQPNGFMAAKGMLDFAGGTVVHINAGVAALAVAIYMGKRVGNPADFKPYSPLMSMIGASLLWVGWFGFNAGSAVAANGRAGMAMTVTMIATAVAALAWMITEWSVKGKPSTVGILSGAVAGLVAITPASGYVDTVGSMWIGLAAGVFCYLAGAKFKPIFGFDDSLDAFGVHGVGGFIGALLTGVFATSAITGSDTMKGLLDGNPGQMMVQLEGICATIAWSGIMTLVICFIVDKTMGLRVSAEEEKTGLDLSQHGEMLDH